MAMELAVVSLMWVSPKHSFFDTQNRVRVTFKDVAGLSGAKQEVEEIVHFLKEPQKYTALGGKIPKGGSFGRSSRYR